MPSLIFMRMVKCNVDHICNPDSIGLAKLFEKAIMDYVTKTEYLKTQWEICQHPVARQTAETLARNSLTKGCDIVEWYEIALECYGRCLPSDKQVRSN